ncbi:MAG: family 78 glycoside hydrolase catalytic domain [Phycisphaeraceae bacterium]|nr:family 78 glycoside hydrolase catalytic domain [Phycisphaeraceae bacterium]
MRVRAPEGTVLTIRHAEMLNPDGTIYTQNLRGGGDRHVHLPRWGREEWALRFTFHGFRYVEVAGLLSAPMTDAVTGIVVALTWKAAEFRVL